MHHPSHHRMIQTGSRSITTWLILITIVLYILYSSNTLLFNNDQQECPTTTATLDDTPQEHVHITSYNISSTSDRNIEHKVLPIDQTEEDEEPHQEEEKEEEEEGEVEGEEQEQENKSPIVVRLTNQQMAQREETALKHIVFGIAASSNLWNVRKEYIKIWWRPKQTRGVVWLDKSISTRSNEGLPEIRISSDTSRFRYTNHQGQRSALRISRIVTETLKLGLKDVRWFVMGDDDTVFVVDNVVRILSKYDHRHFYYVGSSSESHVQNIHFSYAMAYGGGGFAISYPLAMELAKMQDRCIQRYPALYGSDDRIQACMAELGVPLTREAGFHQVSVIRDFAFA